MAKGNGKWIQNANLKKGAFTRKAKAADKTVGQYASQVLKPGSKASPKTKKQAVLARTFKNMARNR
jgi:hypothetical protein|tara:strand:+ start:1876 stop:2073 length:198 start_codon:yes stop_codon:yes gene_type:complete